jgi:peptidoglycan/xylan/chitin deacetylase (PgdA/CDA1 family)
MSITKSFWRALSLINARTGIANLYYDRFDVVIVYHSVGEPDKFGNVPEERLRQDFEYLQNQYDVVPLQELAEEKTNSHRKRVAVTFDDAHGNFYRCAYPIISEFSVPVTLFVPEAFVGGEQPELLKERLGVSAVDAETMLSANQIRTVLEDELVELGNHTRTHADLSELTDPNELEREIVGAKDQLEERFDITVDAFAYPYGKLNESAARIVKNSHDLAVTSEPGALTSEREIHTTPRVSGHLLRKELQWELTDLAESFRKINNWLS